MTDETATNETIDLTAIAKEALAKLPTAELLALYNKTSGNKSKKFSTRAKGEDQTLKALQEKKGALLRFVNKAGKDAEKAEAKAAKQAERDAKRAAKGEGEGSGEVDAERSAIIAQTWKDPAVAAARAARHGCKVGGETYSSVSKAFEALGLPMTKVIPFRGKLKKSGAETFVKEDGAKLSFKLVANE